MFPLLLLLAVFLTLSQLAAGNSEEKVDETFRHRCVSLPNAVVIKSSCFVLTVEKKSFDQAKISCRALGTGRLANLKTRPQALMLVDVFANSTLRDSPAIVGIVRPTTDSADHFMRHSAIVWKFGSTSNRLAIQGPLRFGIYMVPKWFRTTEAGGELHDDELVAPNIALLKRDADAHYLCEYPSTVTEETTARAAESIVLHDDEPAKSDREGSGDGADTNDEDFSKTESIDDEDTLTRIHQTADMSEYESEYDDFLSMNETESTKRVGCEEDATGLAWIILHFLIIGLLVVCSGIGIEKYIISKKNVSSGIKSAAMYMKLIEEKKNVATII